MTEATPSTMRRDIVSAYVASGAKVASWVVVSAVVYRQFGAGAFGMLTLTRATIGLLNYASLGLAPAMIHRLAQSGAHAAYGSSSSKVLSYETRRVDPRYDSIFTNGITATLVAATIAAVLTLIYALNFERFHEVSADMPDVRNFVGLMGLGTIARLISDAPGAVLQTRSRIALDNIIVAISDLSWAVFVVAGGKRLGVLTTVAEFYLLANVLLLIARLVAMFRLSQPTLFRPSQLKMSIALDLLGFGVLVCAAQLADFLYAPTDFILINHFFGPNAVAIYSPAVQIDAGLLMLVSALAAVLLPKAALAHASGDVRTIRMLYTRGTLASAGILIGTALVVWLVSPLILRVWFGDPMVRTQAILPFVLIHTVVGGSSAVGRSILLGVGKVKPFTISVLIAGVSNVILSYVFVRFFNLGLRGIVLGTIIAVVGRCAIWMPWYVRRTLRSESSLRGD